MIGRIIGKYTRKWYFDGTMSARNIYGENKGSYGEGIFVGYSGIIRNTTLVQGTSKKDIGILNWGNITATNVKGYGPWSSVGVRIEGNSARVNVTNIYGEGGWGGEIRTGGVLSASKIQAKALYKQYYNYAGVLDCTQDEGGSVTGSISTSCPGDGAPYKYDCSGYGWCKCDGVSVSLASKGRSC